MISSDFRHCFRFLPGNENGWCKPRQVDNN
jgi:hypothetical protein